jgi:hypothetical protein
MLGMVEIESIPACGRQEFLMEGGGKALPFLTGFTFKRLRFHPNEIDVLRI